MKKILALLCTLSCFVFGGCDLSHKHYYNDLGKCNCGSYIAKALTYNSDKEYVSETHSVTPSETYYYEFTAHGEMGCDFIIDNADLEFERIEIRYGGSTYWVPLSVSGTKMKNCDKTFNTGKKFNLKVTYKTSGEMRLIVRQASAEQ